MISIKQLTTWHSMRRATMLVLFLLTVSVMPSQGQDTVLPIDSLHKAGLPKTAELADSNYRLAVFTNIDKKSSEEFEPDLVSVYIFDVETKAFRKLFTTTKSDEVAWYFPHGSESMPCQLKDIHAVYTAHVVPYEKKIVIDGCFDMRNIFSYLIDVDTNEVKHLPTNCGLIGFTPEEGYIVMGSYAYNNAVDEEGEIIGGRHTVMSVFNVDGECIKMIDFEE